MFLSGPSTRRLPFPCFPSAATSLELASSHYRFSSVQRRGRGNCQHQDSRLVRPGLLAYPQPTVRSMYIHTMLACSVTTYCGRTWLGKRKRAVGWRLLTVHAIPSPQYQISTGTLPIRKLVNGGISPGSNHARTALLAPLRETAHATGDTDPCLSTTPVPPLRLSRGLVCGCGAAPYRANWRPVRPLRRMWRLTSCTPAACLLVPTDSNAAPWIWIHMRGPRLSFTRKSSCLNREYARAACCPSHVASGVHYPICGRQQQ
jgi:hypothetical protein